MMAPAHPAIESRHLGEFFAYVRAARHWSRLHPELAAEPDIRSLLDAYPAEEQSPPRVRLTDSLRTEAELRQAHARLNAVFTSITDGLLVLDRRWRYVYFSEQGARIIGMRPEELLGRCVWDVFPHAEGTKFHDGYHRAVATGKAVHFEEFHPEPLNVWLECHCYPSDEGLAVYFRDISERKCAEERSRLMAEKLERQTRIFDTTLSAITDFVYILDREGRFQSVNRALLDLWSLPLEAALGKTFFELPFPEALAAKFHRQVQQVFTTRRRLSDETIYTSPSGETGYYEYIFNPVIGANGAVEAVAGSTRDITERKRHELDLSCLAEIQKLLSSLSSTAEIMRQVCALLADRFQLTHCVLVEINETADEAKVIHDHHAPDAPDLRGLYRIGDFHTDAERAEMQAGRTVAIDDVRQDPRSADSAQRFAALGIGSLAIASYVADGRWKFVLSAMRGGLTAWRQGDLSLLSESAARIYLRLEHARSEESLRESEERFRNTFENAAIGIAHVGLDGRWLRANQVLSHITGYSWEELSTMTFADITHPDDLEPDLALARRAVAGEISTFSMEKRYVRKDGSHVWANITVSVLRDPAGKPLHFISAVEDISEKRAAALELKRQQRFIERLTHVMPSSLYVLDLAGQRIVWANQQISLGTGYAAEEVRAMGPGFVEHLMHPEDLARMPAHFARLAASADGEAVEIDYRFRHRNGDWRWFRSCDTPFARDAEGRVREIIGTATDITEHRRIAAALQSAKEAAEAANRSKDRFLAVLSHELRTPLTPVLLTAAALHEDDRLPPELRAQLGMIERNITLEARLIDDLLDLTRIVNGKMALRSEPCDAHSLLGLVVEMVRGDAQEKGIAIELDLTARRSRLTGDPARLQQVFWNLLRNAVKFTATGGRIRVRSFDPADPGPGLDGTPSSVCFEVSDNGVGFDPAVSVRIFEPFEQATPGQSPGGLGLGLAIARAIVDMHRGSITATSPGVGGGATFLLTLPGAIESPASSETCAGAGHSSSSSYPQPDPSLRLLVVEDDEPTLLVLARLLTRDGYQITTARSLAEARAAAATALVRFDVLVSDLGLPDGTGVELMKELRAIYGLRGIALSGYGTEADLDRSRDAGFTTHLVKPVDLNELRRALHEITKANA